MKLKTLLLFTCLVTLLGTVAFGQNFSKKFLFTEVPHAGGVDVNAKSIYSVKTGYGFEPGSIVECTGNNGCYSDKPFYFSVSLPEGNYALRMRFGNKQSATSTVLKAELRRLLSENIETKKGQLEGRQFVVNVRRPEIAGGGEVKLKDREKTTEWRAWDEKLTLEFNGSKPAIAAIEIEKVDVPTIFLLGDSTVCDQPSEPYASWGQMFTRFFDNTVAIANHAESGESYKSSFGAKRLDKVLSVMKPGDYLLLQYAHNDEKERGEGVGAMTTFKASIKQFVEAFQKKGGHAIVITPMHRRTFDAAGKITNSHGDYPEAARQAAKELNVPLIDLTAMSQQLYEALGPKDSGLLFKEGDGTHHNNYGAYELAKCVVQAIQDQHLPIAKYLSKDWVKFDPKRPDPVASFSVPASPAVTDVKPLGN